MEKKFITYGIHIDPSKFDGIKMERMMYVNKPDGGLWASREDLDSWRKWCELEGFRTDRLKTWTKFELEDDANILIINSIKDLRKIQDKFPLPNPYHVKLIDFKKIESSGYDGVYLTEVGNLQCHLPMDPESFELDLNAWDVESLVLFNLDHIIVKEMG